MISLLVTPFSTINRIFLCFDTTTNEKFISHKELHNIKMQRSQDVLKSFNLMDIFWNNIYYFIVQFLQSYVFI